MRMGGEDLMVTHPAVTYKPSSTHCSLWLSLTKRIPYNHYLTGGFINTFKYLPFPAHLPVTAYPFSMSWCKYFTTKTESDPKTISKSLFKSTLIFLDSTHHDVYLCRFFFV